MIQEKLTVTENKSLTHNIMLMRLSGLSVPSDIRPGQFLNIKIDGLFLRRPISVCDYDGKTITIVYKIVGAGTRKMRELKGGELDVLLPLGNGYDLSASGQAPLVIGAGVGIPPLYYLAKRLVAQNKQVTALLGYHSEGDVFLCDEFRSLGVKTIVVTSDGSVGLKGRVTDHMNLSYTHFYACGPEGMLKGVFLKSVTSGQLSFEERMGCGFGACMGCSCKTVTGYKRICKDGPVLFKEEIVW